MHGETVKYDTFIL